MGLLARPPEAAAALLTPAAWSALAAEFGRAWAAAHGHPPAASHFALALQAGLCVLHTAHAAPRHRGPLGEPELGSLAAALPTARHSRTRLLCRLTGAVLDESNPPLALPNGRVYSRRAVEERAVKGRPGATAEGGECLLVWCPLTGDGPFPLSACRKVFLA
jgi:macrophage erythroblast attacher